MRTDAYGRRFDDDGAQILKPIVVPPRANAPRRREPTAAEVFAELSAASARVHRRYHGPPDPK